MSFKILYVTATALEAKALTEIEGICISPEGFRFGGIEVYLLIAGIGSVETSWSMMKWLSEHPPVDLVINGGIAGSYKENFGIGEVVLPVADLFADAGVEDHKEFLTLSEAGIKDPWDFPFKDGWLKADSEYIELVKKIVSPVRAITLNTATGSDETRKKMINKYNPDIETMEGATFFYICAREKLPFLVLRAVSNMVEPRDKGKWDIPLALNNLSEKLKEILLKLE